ncbi:MAG: hypothetical protein ABFC63_00255 [Thermoguttaceae bacterium]
MNKRRIAIIAVIVLLLSVTAVWAIRRRSDAQFDRVRAMLADRPPSSEDRARIHQEMEKLSPEQRWQLREEMHNQRERRQTEAYFALPPEKRREYLDERIKEQEKWREDMKRRRQEAEQRRAQENPNQPAGSNGARSGQSNNSAAGNQAHSPHGGSRTPESRSSRMNQRLDKRSPQQRAQAMAYRAAMQKRRMELGLPTGHGFGGHHSVGP